MVDVPEPLETRDQLGVEQRHFAVEAEGLGLERREGLGYRVEPLGVVPAWRS